MFLCVLIVIAYFVGMSTSKRLTDKQKDELWRGFVLYQRKNEFHKKDLDRAMRSLNGVDWKNVIYYGQDPFARPDDYTINALLQRKFKFVGDLNNPDDSLQVEFDKAVYGD